MFIPQFIMGGSDNQILAAEPPVAVDDDYYTDNITLSVSADQGVLTNDYDPDVDPLAAIQVNEPFNGILSLNSDGSFTYTHNGSENLTDSFTYKANDGLNDSNIATVNIAIGLTVNEPPLANDDYYSVDQGGILTIDSPGILGNDSDVDGDSLTAIKVSEPAYGMLILNSDGSFSYTHDGSENLTDSFSYVANDGKADSSNATVHISINYLGLFRTSSADDDWLDGWDNRPEIDINHTKIDSQLTHFPVLIHLSDSSGIHQEDVTQIFDEVGFLKIAVSPIFPHLNHLHEHLG